MQYSEQNKKNWNDRVDIHVNAPGYRVADFRNGFNTLKQVERDMLGDVKDKSILHLQCHIGLDSMSLSRLGAKVTAIDFSEKSIAVASNLANDLSLDTRFIISDVATLRDNLSGQFDIAFTSYGVLCWLEDLNLWAETIAHFLKPGGTFLIVEDHPMGDTLDCEGDDYVIRYSYFNQGPLKWESNKSYLGTGTIENAKTYQWFHSLSEIITSLISAGLKIEDFREYPFTFFQKFPNLIEQEDGWYVMPDGNRKIPLMYALKAAK